MVFFLLVSLPTPTLAGDKSVDKVRQIGAFNKWENALSLSEEIQKSGKKAFIMEKTQDGEIFYSVLESLKNIDVSSKPPTVKELGYVQVGSYLNKSNAEQMIIGLRQQGAVTFHCMKKIDEKVYYKVYKKTGMVVTSPCTLDTAGAPKPYTGGRMKHSDASSPSVTLPADSSTMPGKHLITGAADGQGIPLEAGGPAQDMATPLEAYEQESQAPRFIVNGTGAPETDESSEISSYETDAPRFIVNSTDDEISATSPLDEDGTSEDGEVLVTKLDEAVLDESLSEDTHQPLPLSGPLPKRPPITETPPDVVLDISPVRPVDDNIHFYIKSEAVVFTGRDQFGTWYARFNEFGGGMVTGQSNKWYIVRFREGVTGYVQKADTVEYVLPYEDEETYR